MELELPYINPQQFVQALIDDYGFEQSQSWNARCLNMPTEIGQGGIQLFIGSGLHFFRGNWQFKETTIFRTPDPVGHCGMVDFRFNQYGNVQSALLQGNQNFERDTTIVDGMRIFISQQYLSLPARVLRSRMEAYESQPYLLASHQEIIRINALNFSDAMLLESRMLQFIHEWVNYLQRNQSSDQETIALVDRFGSRLEEARTLLDARPEVSYSLRELSRLVGMNECDLKRGFRQRYGLSVHQYVIRVRMHRARFLLHSANYPVSEVIEQLGYTNRGHFAKLYQKYFGIAPHADRPTNFS